MCLFFGPCQLPLRAADASAFRLANNLSAPLAAAAEALARTRAPPAQRGALQRYGCANTAFITSRQAWNAGPDEPQRPAKFPAKRCSRTTSLPRLH